MFIFLTALAALIPGLMVLFGLLWKKYPPRAINAFYGFRTSLSMKNQQTWDFAHAHCARVWLRWGSAMLVLSLAAMLAFQSDMYAASLLVTIAQIIFVVASIFPTVSALNRRFDRNGDPRE